MTSLRIPPHDPGDEDSFDQYPHSVLGSSTIVRCPLFDHREELEVGGLPGS